MLINVCLDLVLVALLCLASAFDLSQRRIPNRLVLLGMVSASVLHLCSDNPLSVVSVGLAGCAVGLVLFVPLYLLRAMAAGDVKLMMMVGAFCGPELTVEVSMATYCAGGLLALLIVVARGRAMEAARNVRSMLLTLMWRMAAAPLAAEPAPPSVGSMPYGVAIAAGTFFILWLRHA